MKNLFNSRVTDKLFAEAVEKFGKVLLHKSQTPSMKLEKKQALEEIAAYIETQSAVRMKDAQILKKLNNMKCRIKVKRDRTKKIGNKRTNLNLGESILFSLMRAITADSKDPQIERLDYGISCGSAPNPDHSEPSTIKVEELDDDDGDPSTNSTFTNDCAGKPEMNEGPTNAPDVEVSTEKLQRIVLLKQLEVFEMQKDFYQAAKKTLRNIDGCVDRIKKRIKIE